MAESLNTVALVGNLAADPDNPHPSILRYRIAVTSREKEGENWVDKPNFITVKTFGSENRINSLLRMLTKGSRVGVSGKLLVDEYTNKDGDRRSETYVKAFDVQLLGEPKGRATDIPADSIPQGTEAKKNDDDIPF